MTSQAASQREPASSPAQARDRAIAMLFRQQREDGSWWYTLEANETIGAGLIQVLRFVGESDPDLEKGLTKRMISQQREDGSWGIFYGAPGDLSATIECYFALRLAGHSPEEDALKKARTFILSQGDS